MAKSIDDVTKTIYVNWYHACTIINVDITTKKHMQRQKVLDFVRLITHAIFSEFVYLWFSVQKMPLEGVDALQCVADEA